MATAVKRLARLRVVYGATWRIDQREVERQSGPAYIGYVAVNRISGEVLSARTLDALEYLLQGHVN